MADLAANFKIWMGSYGKVVSLIVTMAAGAAVPQASALSFMVQYFLMVMLFLAFLDIEFNPRSFTTSAVKVLLANLLVGFGAYLVFSGINAELAMAAFITGIAPTAISSTVIISFIEGQVEFMIAAVLLTNIAMAVVIPLAIPYVVGTTVEVSIWEVLWPVLITMFVPLILARIAAHLPGKAQSILRAGKRFSFLVWLVNLFIISAKASDFIIHESTGSWGTLAQIALIALIICVIDFLLGALLGGRSYWQESSQALGQKNNSFAIWIALTFMNPLVAMGPTFYILYHNLYNAWQIYRFERRNEERIWKNQTSE